MKKQNLTLLLFLFLLKNLQAQSLYIPRNVQAAYEKNTRSMDGKPGARYWQNRGRYNINLTVTPPSRTIKGSESIVYINNSPDTVRNPIVKLIMNIHAKGAARQFPVSDGYLSTGIKIDNYTENGTKKTLKDAENRTYVPIKLSKGIPPKDSIRLTFDWHYDISLESGREGMLDSTTFFLAYFYPRIAVLDDVTGWDRMTFTDAQEFYNDFNDYNLSVNVPKNFLVWATGDLKNVNDVLQPAFAVKFNASLTADKSANITTIEDLKAKNITNQNATNTWIFTSADISDVALCVSDHYLWDAASVVVDKKTGRRASVQAAYDNSAINFRKMVDFGQNALSWFSNNYPGVPYPFSKSTIVQGTADMEYPMMANDSEQENPLFSQFIAEHEIAHSWFPFYMGINEHRYGSMDEGWTTAFEYLIGSHDNGEEKASQLFKQFRVNRWIKDGNEEHQIPIIVPGNTLSGAGLGINQYGKPALAYLGMKDMLGDEQFTKCLHGFMERWHGKHPIPWDMFFSFNDIAGKNMNWYWNNWFFTTNYIDLAVKEVVLKKKNAKITIQNIGGFAAPVDILVQYEDGTTEKKHQTAAIWEQNQRETTVKIDLSKPVKSIKLDGHIWVDANEKDNVWTVKK